MPSVRDGQPSPAQPTVRAHPYHVVNNPHCLAYRGRLEPHMLHALQELFRRDGSAVKLVKVEVFHLLRPVRHGPRLDQDSVLGRCWCGIGVMIFHDACDVCWCLIQEE